jgi:hypothetical protein
MPRGRDDKVTRADVATRCQADPGVRGQRVGAALQACRQRVGRGTVGGAGGRQRLQPLQRGLGLQTDDDARIGSQRAGAAQAAGQGRDEGGSQQSHAAAV